MSAGCAEDACPVDALELTQDFELASYTREGAIWDRKMLEEGPHPKEVQVLTRGRQDSARWFAMITHCSFTRSVLMTLGGLHHHHPQERRA